MKKQICFRLSVFLFLLISSCNSPESEDIPFSFDRNVYFAGTINDTIKGNFMFDTGAFGFYLDSTYEQNSGIKDVAIISEICPNPDNRWRRKFLELTVANITYTTDNSYTLDMKRSFGRSCDGIIGWDLFKDQAIFIDYKKQTVKVVAVEKFSFDPAYKKIPLTFKENRIYVTPEIILANGKKITAEFLLDVGYGGCIIFTNESVQKYKLDSLATKKMEFTGAWGSLYDRSSGFVFRGKSLKLGGLELTEPLLDCSRNEKGILASGPYAGLLGNTALKKFEVIIDFAGQMLYLKPNADNTKKMKMTLGMGFIDRTDICEGWLVNIIQPESEAGKAGIKPGDIVTHIDQKPVQNIAKSSLDELFDKEGEEILFTIKRENEILNFKIRLKESL